MHGGGRDGGLTHGDRDLVQRVHHVARGIEAGHARALVGVHDEVAGLGQRGAQLARELVAAACPGQRVRHLVMVAATVGRLELDAVGDRMQRHHGFGHDGKSVRAGHVVRERLAPAVDGHVRAEMAQEPCMADGAFAVAQHADAPAARLVRVADRTGAQHAALQRFAHRRERRPGVEHARREQHEPRAPLARTAAQHERVAVALDRQHFVGRAFDRISRELPPQAPQQHAAADARGERGIVARARDQLGAALAGVDEDGRAQVAAEVDAGHQPRGAAADDRAIVVRERAVHGA